MKPVSLSLLIFTFLLASCSSSKNLSPEDFQNQGHQLVYDMGQKVGTYQDLLKKNNVIYTYTYQTPDGKKDVSTEVYVFDGELSYGRYDTHERTLAELDGPLIQGYDGTDFWIKNGERPLTDDAAQKRTRFNRKTNFYWFAMMQKLLDPGLIYEHLGTATVDGSQYDIVKVGFDSSAPSDIYQLYINQETGLVDQFLFTVVDFGVTEPYLMTMKYTEVDGMLIPNKRKYIKADWDGNIKGEQWIDVNWTDIRFDQNIDLSLFKG